MSKEQLTTISENLRVYLPIPLALSLILGVFWGGWNLNDLKHSIDTQFNSIYFKLEQLETKNTSTITVAHAKLWCFHAEKLNPGFVCPSIDQIVKDLGG